MQKMIRNFPILVFFLFLTACYPNLTGVWKLTTETTAINDPKCTDYDRDEIFYFTVTHEGGEIYGNSISSPQDWYASGQVGDVEFAGMVPARKFGNTIDLVFWLPDHASQDGCGDSWKANGSLSGSTVSGTFVGGDCKSVNARVRSQQDEKWIDGCTWSGTFKAEITR
ncbi:hypothetical protein ACFLTX_01975 [Chloroflexota bacterium]